MSRMNHKRCVPNNVLSIWTTTSWYWFLHIQLLTTTWKRFSLVGITTCKYQIRRISKESTSFIYFPILLLQPYNYRSYIDLEHILVHSNSSAMMISHFRTIISQSGKTRNKLAATIYVFFEPIIGTSNIWGFANRI